MDSSDGVEPETPAVAAALAAAAEAAAGPAAPEDRFVEPGEIREALKQFSRRIADVEGLSAPDREQYRGWQCPR